MKRHTVWVLGLLSVALAVTPQGPAPQPACSTLAKLMPGGPLLYVESPDFAGLVRDWHNSPEKKAWLASDNYQAFSRSRLFLRLGEAREEFAGAAGVPPDIALLESVAGSESALGIYDIGKLEFLYITRLPSARVIDNALWRGKEKFEPRRVADITYYVHTEPSKGRLAALATYNDYLLLATREDLIAGALAVLSGKAMHTLADEPWFAAATAAAGQRGDLRLALNLTSLVKAPHFRSYWIQRNVPELRQYTAEVTDIRRSAEEIREERVLLRSATASALTGQASAEDATLANLLRLVPASGGVYRAWRAPSVDQALELLAGKVLSPRVGRGVVPTRAPSVTLSEGETGGEGDLETRIDVPPLASVGGTFEPEALRKLLTAAKLEGALQLESTRGLPGDVFVGTQSAIVLQGAGDWEGEAVRSALLSAVGGLWTTSHLGAKWVERGAGETGYSEFDGLTHLAMAARGRILIVGNGGEPVVAVLKQMSGAVGKEGGVYAAGFRHAAERSDIVRMTRLIEAPFAQQFGGGGGLGGHEPWFFSENLASLSLSLARVESESILVRDRGPLVSQTVIYRLSK
ncbi:MAG: hypothetical protein LAN62_13490 [Acidobacteriia bacterium]|nr:hypothetical protein [Terriglobia bacterium]